ncbi:MAG: prepilin peptidase [Planctomycetota bacterium]|jgi:leader peptidase (prepilin peptidase)/N-methyltransferase
MMDSILLAAVILLASCVGSFLNVVIYRLPEGTFFSKGSRSRCPHCGVAIRWFDNVPVVSWLLLRGRARCCGNRISLRYPLVEALTAGLMVALWLSVMEQGAAAPTAEQWLRFVLQAWFLAILVACTFIDIDHRILPDVLTKPTMVVGCVGAVLVPGLAGELPGWLPQKPAADSLLLALSGLAAGFGLTWAVRAGASKAFGQEAMGFGDVKFMAAIGAFVGWDGVLTTFILGVLLGAVYGVFHKWITGEAEVCFGPFLAAGAAITLFFKKPLLVFLTETLPTWQAQQDPLVLLGVTVVCIVFLVVLIRRGRARLKAGHDRRD